MSAEQAATSGLFNPENFSAGGFFDDVDGTIVTAEVGTWDEVPDKCFVTLGLRKDGDDEDTELRKEYYTIGDLDKFTPSKDHTRAVYEDGVRMNGNVKFALFVKSLINAGFPKSSIADDVRFLVGLRAHFNIVSLSIKSDSKNFKGKKKEGGPTVLLVTKLLDAAAPVAAKTAPASTKKPAQAPTSAAPAAADGAEDTAVGVILNKLSETGELAKRNLPNIMFQSIKDVETRKMAMKLASDSAWLGSEERPWTFDEGSGTLKA